MVSIYQTSIAEKKKRARFAATELLRRYRKFLKIQSHRLQEDHMLLLMKTGQSLALPSIKNKCLVSGSSHSIYKHFRLSRHQVKNYFRFLKIRPSSF